MLSEKIAALLAKSLSLRKCFAICRITFQFLLLPALSFATNEHDTGHDL